MYDNQERLKLPEEPLRRKEVVFVGTRNVINAEIVAFGPRLEAKQAQSVIQQPRPQEVIAPVYDMSDYAQVQSQPQPTPEVAVHENQVGIDEAKAKVAEAIREAA